MGTFIPNWSKQQQFASPKVHQKTTPIPDRSTNEYISNDEHVKRKFHNCTYQCEQMIILTSYQQTSAQSSNVF